MKKIPFGSGATILIVCKAPQLSHVKLYDFEVSGQDFQFRGDTVVRLGRIAVVRRSHSLKL